MRPDDWKRLMPTVARRLLGEPSRAHSTAKKLRWGTNGSFSVDIDRGVFYDFERKEGGGAKQLILTHGHRDPIAWLKAEGLYRAR